MQFGTRQGRYQVKKNHGLHVECLYTACQQKKAALEHNGATCHNFVDATNGKAVLEPLGIDKVDVGVWGSPHPRNFNALFPDLDPSRFVTNGDYKAV